MPIKWRVSLCTFRENDTSNQVPRIIFFDVWALARWSSFSWQYFTFCSLLLLRRMLLHCPSGWVIECNNRIRARNELCRFRSISSFLQHVLQKCFFIKSSVPFLLNNNRRSKLHAFTGGLSFFFLRNPKLSQVLKIKNITENRVRWSW